MKNKTIGFIGGGRVVRIFLEAMKRKNEFPAKIFVTDPDMAVLDKLAATYPEAKVIKSSINEAAAQDVVFLAMHPPVMGETLTKIAGMIKPQTLVVSLAPKFTCAKISEMLNGHKKIARMIPNAPSVVNAGFNPVYFDSGISATEKQELLDFFAVLGQAPVVAENLLEAYAMIAAMGPTYLWFQWHELEKLAVEFGMTEEQAKTAMYNMLTGAIKTMHRSGLSYEQVIDLVPVKPITEHEPQILEIYRTKLTALFNKIKP
ncbi:MAG TPA: NAD(P)-binding domain-containing protein [bacterium]|nr:NAD(P)-binding domain-containing protein [bacterium]HPN45950.1 NAD(P)-binding domain-containing protein [bacterium]